MWWRMIRHSPAPFARAVFPYSSESCSSTDAPNDDGDHEPARRRTHDEGARDARSREDDVRDGLASLKRVSEVAVRKPVDEMEVLRVPGPVDAHDACDLPHPRRRRPFAGD